MGFRSLLKGTRYTYSIFQPSLKFSHVPDLPHRVYANKCIPSMRSWFTCYGHFQDCGTPKELDPNATAIPPTPDVNVLQRRPWIGLFHRSSIDLVGFLHSNDSKKPELVSKSWNNPIILPWLYISTNKIRDMKKYSCSG